CALVGWARAGGALTRWVEAGLQRGSWSVIGPSVTAAPVSGARRATTGGVTGGVAGARGAAPGGVLTAGAQLRAARPLRFGWVGGLPGGPSGVSRADGGIVDSRRGPLLGCVIGGATVWVGVPGSSAARRRRRPVLVGADSPYRASSSATVNCARSSGSLLRLIVPYRAPRATVRPVRRGGRRVSCAVRSIPSNQSNQSNLRKMTPSRNAHGQRSISSTSSACIVAWVTSAPATSW